jgi:hypothetical protein
VSSADRVIADAKSFVFYARNLWPLHRMLVGSRLSRRCSRCVISEAWTPLTEAGICRECAGAPDDVGSSHRAADERQQLEAILRAYQGRGVGRWDAVVLFSGGKDSIYMLHRLLEGFPGLRLLALTVDNGFMSPVAMEAVHEVITKLDVDHIVFRHRSTTVKTLFRYTITHLNEKGCAGTVDFSDGELLIDTARNLAARMEIPLVLCGYSRYQAQGGLGLDSFESPPEQERTTRTHVSGIPLEEIYGGGDLSMWWHGAEWSPSRVPRLLFPLFAWDLEESFIREQVIRMGFLDESRVDPLVTNHTLIPLLGVVDVWNVGCSTYEPEFAQMIREGRADKGHWRNIFEMIEYSARTGRFVGRAVAEGLAQLDLKPVDVGLPERVFS